MWQANRRKREIIDIALQNEHEERGSSHRAEWSRDGHPRRRARDFERCPDEKYAGAAEGQEINRTGRKLSAGRQELEHQAARVKECRRQRSQSVSRHADRGTDRGRGGTHAEEQLVAAPEFRRSRERPEALTEDGRKDVHA